MSEMAVLGAAEKEAELPGFRANTSVDIVIPVLNEEGALPGCVRTLHAFLRESLPMAWRITIVDNGSTDGTWWSAQMLSADLEGVYARRIKTRGKGAAVKAAWRDSPADLVAYLDCDLSTGLDALLPLLAPLASGHSDLAIGTRLGNGARTYRCLKREVVSRGYNALLRVGFGVRFTDAACGFKAARAAVVRPLLDKVADDHWFFDTELLLLAEHNGLRIHEVPVDWIEDRVSKVSVGPTALCDLKGLLRFTRSVARGDAVVDLPARPAPRPAHPDMAPVGLRPWALLVRKLLSFALIGMVATVVHCVLYALLRGSWPPAWANLAALLATAALNTEANRRWTFGREAGGPLARVHLRAGLLFLAYYVVTSAALEAAAGWERGRAAELCALVTAYGAMTVLRFVALDRWVFARRPRVTR